MVDIREVRALVLEAMRKPLPDENRDYEALAQSSLVGMFNRLAGDYALTAHIRDA